MAKKAKTPLLAGGAALAGLAGAVAVRSRSNHRSGPVSAVTKALSGSRPKSLGLPQLPKRDGLTDGVRKLSKNVSKAAQRADQIGQQVSKAANAVQKVSETAEGAAKKV